MNQHDPLIMEELLGNLPGMAYRCWNDPEWPMLFISEGVFDLTGYHPADLPWPSLDDPVPRERD